MKRIAVVVLGLIALVTLAACSSSSDGRGQKFPDQGATHIGIGDSHPPYNSVPATSGWHFSTLLAPAPWDVYAEAIPDEVLTHNLEHGGIGIHYNCPNGCDELVDQLANIARGGGKIVMSPYPGMETRIALTAWNFLDAFDDFDGDRIKDFIDAHESSSNAPEPNVR